MAEATANINDQEAIVGHLNLEDAVNLPAGDSIAGASWTADNTDVTVGPGDTSKTSPDGGVVDPTKVTASASGTALGLANLVGTLTTASGATVIVDAQVTVNGGPATQAAVAFDAAQPV